MKNIIILGVFILLFAGCSKQEVSHQLLVFKSESNPNWELRFENVTNENQSKDYIYYKIEFKYKGNDEEKIKDFTYLFNSQGFSLGGILKLNEGKATVVNCNQFFYPVSDINAIADVRIKWNGKEEVIPLRYVE